MTSAALSEAVSQVPGGTSQTRNSTTGQPRSSTTSQPRNSTTGQPGNKIIGRPQDVVALGIRPAPRREPPFEDEPASRRLTLVGPLDQPLPLHTVDLHAPSPLRLLAEADPFGVQPTSRIDLPPAAAFARRLLIAVIETATGRRSASQLRLHTSPAVQSGLARDAGRIGRLGSTARPASLHSLHIAEPADGVAEVAAIVRVDDRFRAIALRLEGLDGRWQCVRLQIG